MVLNINILQWSQPPHLSWLRDTHQAECTYLLSLSSPQPFHTLISHLQLALTTGLYDSSLHHTFHFIANEILVCF